MKREAKVVRVDRLRVSVLRCPQAGGPCGGEVAMGRGNIRHLGRCRRCGVVLGRKGRRWAVLTEKQWAQIGVGAVCMEFIKQDIAPAERKGGRR